MKKPVKLINASSLEDNWTIIRLPNHPFGSFPIHRLGRQNILTWCHSAHKHATNRHVANHRSAFDFRHYDILCAIDHSRPITHHSHKPAAKDVASTFSTLSPTQSHTALWPSFGCTRNTSQSFNEHFDGSSTALSDHSEGFFTPVSLHAGVCIDTNTQQQQKNSHHILKWWSLGLLLPGWRNATASQWSLVLPHKPTRSLVRVEGSSRGDQQGDIFSTLTMRTMQAPKSASNVLRCFGDISVHNVCGEVA